MAATIQVGENIPDTHYFIALRNNQDDSLVLFDTPQEAVGTLDPAYLSEGAAGDHAAFAARRHLALAFIAAGHDRLDPHRVAAMSDSERFALSARGRRPVTEVTEWTSDLPLYVLAACHAPYTDVPLPQGEEVHPIDPYTEVSLVTSLADAGLLDAWHVEAGQTWDGGGE
ncbi:hypothetical protein [Actinomyces gaoshouyii]|uniref:hypothetical protein n=1 Tax=Actinomyces gaoshouyii TaxID=1960083 RepID=UPI0009BC95EE|nr:hypothetical protein [Actinomyces gaoshouyii]ARD42481.1 hypothetical protein B6G06_09135 [Actinomyces gaoshouyii]